MTQEYSFTPEQQRIRAMNYKRPRHIFLYRQWLPILIFGLIAITSILVTTIDTVEDIMLTKADTNVVAKVEHVYIFHPSRGESKEIVTVSYSHEGIEYSTQFRQKPIGLKLYQILDYKIDPKEPTHGKPTYLINSNKESFNDFLGVVTFLFLLASAIPILRLIIFCKITDKEALERISQKSKNPNYAQEWAETFPEYNKLLSAKTGNIQIPKEHQPLRHFSKSACVLIVLSVPIIGILIMGISLIYAS